MQGAVPSGAAGAGYNAVRRLREASQTAAEVAGAGALQSGAPAEQTFLSIISEVDVRLIDILGVHGTNALACASTQTNQNMATAKECLITEKGDIIKQTIMLNNNTEWDGLSDEEKLFIIHQLTTEKESFLAKTTTEPSSESTGGEETDLNNYQKLPAYVTYFYVYYHKIENILPFYPILCFN